MRTGAHALTLRAGSPKKSWRRFCMKLQKTIIELIFNNSREIFGVLSLAHFFFCKFLGTFYLFDSSFFGSSNQSAKVAGSRPLLAPFMHSSSPSSSSSSWALAASIVCLLGLVFHFLCFVSCFVLFGFVSFRFVVFAYEVRNLTKRGKQLH